MRFFSAIPSLVRNVLIFAAINVTIGTVLGCSSAQVTRESARVPSNSTSLSDSVGELFWGRDVDSGLAWSASSIKAFILRHPDSHLAIEANRLMTGAQKDIQSGLVIAPVAHLDLVAGDPGRVTSQTAINQLPHVFGLAVCSRLAPDPLPAECLSAARTGIIGDENHPGWIGTYIPSGNPINEARLMVLFYAMDWVMPVLEPSDRLAVQRWLSNFVIVSDSVYRAKKPGDSTSVNNFNTWRLALRSIVAKVSGRPNLIAANAPSVHSQVVNNLLAPAGWKPSPLCPNDQNILAYGGFDFRQRDALTYHAWNLEGWTPIALYTPENLTTDDYQTILSAFLFLQPYYTGQQTHVDFLCSPEIHPQDAKACASGEAGYCPHDWDSTASPAPGIFRQARPAFPEIKSWTTSALSGSSDASIEFRAALFGD